MNELNKPFFEFILYHNLLEVIACTSIESMVNSAGINILSENYYKKNLERSNILIKIKLLIAITSKVEIEDDNKFIKIIENMFNRRNSLVHPKSKQVSNVNLHEYASDTFNINDADIKELVKNLGKVISSFNRYKLITIKYMYIISKDILTPIFYAFQRLYPRNCFLIYIQISPLIMITN